MSGITWTLIGVVLIATPAYRRTPLWAWTAAAALFVAAVQATGAGFSLLPWIAFAAVAILLNVGSVRQSLLSKPLLGWFRKVLPPMSDTEKDAIDAGTVWWDAELFTGKPNWNRLLASPAASLSDEEQAFIDGPVEEFCRLLDDWAITRELNDLPPEAWDFIRKHRLFGMIIPKEYGGLEFSARAQSKWS